MISGNILRYQNYSLHDGPGIRTTLFFKGCPLRCRWCHNPESQAKEAELEFNGDNCNLCGWCVKVCPQQAITIIDGSLVTDRELCTACGKCVDYCVQQCRKVVGETVTVEQVMTRLLKDQIFYDESDGGVTFSGGEVFSQYEFLVALLDECRYHGLHTAVDSCGFAKFAQIEAIVDKVDLFLYDIKLLDSTRHKAETGVANEVIIENLKKLSKIHSNIIVRVPIIAGINTFSENWQMLKELLCELRISALHLLPYHEYGKDKYLRLGRQYNLNKDNKVTDSYLQSLKKEFSNADYPVIIGGLS